MKRLLLILAISAASLTANAQRPLYMGMGGGYIAPDMWNAEMYLAWNAWEPAERAWMYGLGLNFRPVNFDEKLKTPVQAHSLALFFDAGRNVASDIFYIGGRVEATRNSLPETAQAQLSSGRKDFDRVFLGLGGHFHMGAIVPLGQSLWLKVRGTAGINWYYQHKSTTPEKSRYAPSDNVKFSAGLNLMFEFAL